MNSMLLPDHSPADEYMKERVATPTRFGEVIPAIVALGLWLFVYAPMGAYAAIMNAWLPITALPMLGWTILMRLHYSRMTFAMSYGGMLKRRIELNNLASVTWKQTGTWRSRGTIFLRDRSGRKVPIYVGRFNRLSEWGPLIVSAADRCNAEIDPQSRTYLGSGHPPKRAMSWLFRLFGWRD